MINKFIKHCPDCHHIKISQVNIAPNRRDIDNYIFLTCDCLNIFGENNHFCRNMGYDDHTQNYRILHNIQEWNRLAIDHYL